MKQLIVAIIIVLISVMCFIQFTTYQNACIKNESEEILQKAYTLIESPEDKNETMKEDVYNNKISNNENINQISELIITEEGIIGILVIPKLNIEAPIREGTSQDIMKTSIGHFKESNYWNGNVSFASHNGGTYAHYFEKIHLLNQNDEIKYISKLGTKIYRVEEIKKIKSTDWSMVVGKNENEEINKNTITLITCVNESDDYRLCVRGIEINEI